jgi:hypothetical protein
MTVDNGRSAPELCVENRNRIGPRRRTPIPLGKRERREALDYWRKVGVLDEQGNVTSQWHRRVGALISWGGARLVLAVRHRRPRQVGRASCRLAFSNSAIQR